MPDAASRSPSIAASTGDGSTVPALHAAPLDTLTPSRSSAATSSAPDHPGHTSIETCGARRDGSPATRAATSPESIATSARSRASRRGAMRCIAHASAASVLARQRRGPRRATGRRCRDGGPSPARRRAAPARGGRPARATSAPMPFGPRILWAARLAESASAMADGRPCPTPARHRRERARPRRARSRSPRARAG